MSEHPVQQKIAAVIIKRGPPGQDAEEAYYLDFEDVTRIEACTKSGMHANIPYIRVWKGETCIGEWCQHGIAGVYFEEEEGTT